MIIPMVKFIRYYLLWFAYFEFYYKSFLYKGHKEFYIYSKNFEVCLLSLSWFYLDSKKKFYCGVYSYTEKFIQLNVPINYKVITYITTTQVKN